MKLIVTKKELKYLKKMCPYKWDNIPCENCRYNQECSILFELDGTIPNSYNDTIINKIIRKARSLKQIGD